MKSAPNYTNAFLVAAGVNLFVWLVVLWAAAGYLSALFAAGLIYYLIRART